jgi:hypothetical protein
MTLQIGVYQDRKTTSDTYGIGTRMLADWTLDARGVTFTTDDYGFGACSFMVEMDSDQATLWKNSPGAPRCTISDGPFVVWEGQAEKIGTTDGGISVTALGMFREYATLTPIRELWSTTRADDWHIINSDERASRSPGKYQMDLNDRLYATLAGDTTYTINVDMATFMLKIPYSGIQDLVQFTFVYDILLPTYFTVKIYSETNLSTGATLEWSLVGNGAAQSGTVALTLASDKQQLLVDVVPNTTVAYAALDPGALHAKLTSLRVWATSGSTVLASDVVTSLVQFVNGSSPSVPTSGIQASSMDLLDLVFEDQMPLKCIDILRDRASEAGRWAFEVWEGRQAYFYPAVRSDTPIAYIDDAVFYHERDIDRLATAASVIYDNEHEFHKLRRTANTAQNVKERNRHIINRVIPHRASTTDSAQALSESASLLEDHSSIITVGTIVFSEAFDERGAPIPVWMIRKGWQIAPRRDHIINYHEESNLILVGRTSYNVDTGEMTVEPINAPATMEAALAYKNW